MRAYITWILAHRRLVLATMLLITLALGSQIRNLRIVIDPIAMLPKAHPNVVGTHTAEAIFGSKYMVVIGLSASAGGTALTPEVLGVVSTLTKALADVPGVKRHTLLSVTSEKSKAISGRQGEMQVTPLLEQPIHAQGIQRLAERLRENPMYQGTVISSDGSVTSISFSIDVGPKGFREVMDRVMLAVDAQANPQVRVDLSGAPVFFATVERFSQRMAYLFPIALVLIGLIHFEAFRTLQGMLLPLVTAVLAVIWSVGIMGALKVPMDAFNATTPILILAVAAGHAVQILKRYYEEYDKLRQHGSAIDSQDLNDLAILNSLSRIGPVMLTAGLVAAAGFFSLISFDIATIRTFGIITGLGVLCALCIELTLIPSVRSLLKAPPALALESSRGITAWDRFADALVTLVQQSRGKIAIGFAVLAAIFSTGLLHLNQENSTKSYFGESLPVRLQDRFLNERLAGTNTLYVVLQADRSDRMKEPDILQLVEKFQRYIETLPEVGKTISLVDPLRQMNWALNAGAKDSFTLPSARDLISQYLLLYSISGQPNDFDSYVDYEYRNLNLVVWTKNDSSRYAQHMVNHIRQYIEPQLPAGVTLKIGGSVPQTSALSETLVQGKLKNIAQMILVVYLAGLLIFRSWLASVYLILPLVVTVLANFGVMGLFGIPLNTPNSVSSAMGIGIGADYAIYLLYRLREEMQADDDFDRALKVTMRSAGKAVVYVATAVAGGYSVLLFSFNFYVHIWFGLLIVLSMIISACTALLLIPALLSLHVPACLRRQSTPDQPRLQKPFATPLAVFAAATMIALSPLSSSPVRAQGAKVSADELMQRSYQANRLDSSISNATFRLVSGSGQERLRKTYGATKLGVDGKLNRRVVRFLAPADVRNTTSLLIENNRGDDEIWVYLPALKKARRIAGSGKKGSFFGTDLSYGDVVGHRPEAWIHRWLREEPFAGQVCDLIESVPASPAVAEESGYSKRLSWLARGHHMPLKVEMFDSAGAPLKTVLSSEIKQVDSAKNKWQALKLEARNVQTGHSTFIAMERFDANVAVAEEVFSSRYLEKEE